MIRRDHLGNWVSIPCIVGDYVYELNKSREKVETKKVRNIEINIGRGNCYAVHIEFEVCGFCRPSDFGKTVFKTPGDAAHALDEYLSRKKK